MEECKEMGTNWWVCKIQKIQNKILVYSIKLFTIYNTQAYNLKNVPNNLIANVAGTPQGTIRNCKDNNRWLNNKWTKITTCGVQVEWWEYLPAFATELCTKQKIYSDLTKYEFSLGCIWRN